MESFNMSNNPFEYMQLLNDNFTKNLKNLPMMDFSAFSNMVKNTTEAVNATNQMFSENLQNLYKKGSESLQKNNTELYNAMKNAISSGDAQQINDCQQKYLAAMAENNLSNAKELITLSNKSATEVVDLFNKVLKENSNKNNSSPSKK